ncbi:hypothetical protein POM88_000342 [Heracleum sosnowskyi]|uniref:Uncharacterized protein n=1 Tax=Heracleum sosnowskyi TaxID=360622 RepID=A0AAD8JE57_9APIA|nr:hypothetical protein POM88_000342 [Heracleum sosnowskyi]
MKDGFYNRVKSELQGQLNTYYVGGLMGFELTERNSTYAMALVRKHFANDNLQPDFPLLLYYSCVFDYFFEPFEQFCGIHGTVDLVPRESNMLGRNSPNRNNQVLRYPVELARGSDNVVTGWPVDLQLCTYRIHIFFVLLGLLEEAKALLQAYDALDNLHDT